MEVISAHQLKTWIEAAENARHLLALGQLEVEVSYDGQGLVKYTAANVTTLDKYINELKDRYKAASGQGRARRAHRVIF
ncbi:MAG: gpW family head-tail joining protein [Parvibaculum sp.]